MAASDAILYWRLKLSFIYNVKRTKTVSSHQIISVVSRRASKLPTLGWTLMSNAPSWEQMTWRMPENRPGRGGGKGMLGTHWVACTCTLHVYALVRALCSYTWVINFTSLSRSINCIHKVKQFLFLSWVSLIKNSEEGSESSVYSKFSASSSKVTHTNDN